MTVPDRDAWIAGYLAAATQWQDQHPCCGKPDQADATYAYEQRFGRTVEMIELRNVRATPLDVSGLPAGPAVPVCVRTEDNDMEAFAALPDCPACGGTGKEDVTVIRP